MPPAGELYAVLSFLVVEISTLRWVFLKEQTKFAVDFMSEVDN
jgi:hypothetical protein